MKIFSKMKKINGFQILWVLFLKLFGVGVQIEIRVGVGLHNGLGFGVGVAVVYSRKTPLKYKTSRTDRK
jgi:hypothetical protein